MALTADGICSMSPRSAATAVSICASVTSAAETVSSTSPSASSVEVVWPSRMVAAYDLAVAVSSPRIFVARSMPITSTPVAIGSRVPAWPTFRVPKMRLQRPTTSWLVMPAGLSTTTRPACPSDSQHDRRQRQAVAHRPAARQRRQRRAGFGGRIDQDPRNETARRTGASTSKVMCASSKPSQRCVSGNHAL